MSQQQKSYLLPIAMMFALFAMISFVTGLPAPFGVIVQSDSEPTSLLTHLWVYLRAYYFKKLDIRKQL